MHYLFAFYCCFIVCSQVSLSIHRGSADNLTYLAYLLHTNTTIHSAMLYEEDSEISVEMQTSFSSEKASNRISNSTTDSHLCQRQEQIKRENMSTILTVMICSTMWSLVTTGWLYSLCCVDCKVLFSQLVLLTISNSLQYIYIFLAVVPVFVHTIGSNNLHPEYE